MLDPVIQEFLDGRKALWLKKKVSGKTTDEEQLEFEQQATAKFSLAEWLPDAAKRAKQLSLVSHPEKFSQPSVKGTTPVIASSANATDGFLRTGNVAVGLDIQGNAAALDVYSFLSLKLKDGATILTHLETKTTLIQKQLTVPRIPFAEIEQGLMAIKKNKDPLVKTSGLIKQVYFPVGKDYHLLSILTSSSLVYKLKERIINMHFSDDAKEVREAKRNNKPHDNKMAEIYGLSVVGYGGTKPQNISVLNSRHGGAAYLLSSGPPELTAHPVRPPRVNFFSDSLWPKAFNDDFRKFHKILETPQRDVHIRRKRDWLIRSILFQVADRLWMIRSLEEGWSDSDNYRDLPQYQKIWLDQQYTYTREDDLDWFSSIRMGLVRWFGHTYKKLLGNKALSMGDEQLSHLKKMVDECREALL